MLYLACNYKMSCISTCLAYYFGCFLTYTNHQRMASKHNILRYTSSMGPAIAMPSQTELKEITHMMKDLQPSVKLVCTFKDKLEKLLPVRKNTIELLSEAIDVLDKHHLNVNIAKVTGNSVSLVGDGLIVGGLIAAPFTLGTSLILTLVGGGVCVAGGATSAGAGIAEIFISRKMVKQLQNAIDEDNRLTKEVTDLWTAITVNCETVARNYISVSKEDVFGVLFACIIKIADHIDDVKMTAAHTFDFFSGIGSGVNSLQAGGTLVGGAVLTVLLIRFAPRGAKAITHCSKMCTISKKIVWAAKIFRIGTGVGPLSIAFTVFGTVVDVASLIYSSYQIHKKSHSSAGKELVRKQKELQDAKKRLEEMNDALVTVVN